MDNTNSNLEEKESLFDLNKIIEPFSSKEYNEDFIITSNLLKYQLKNLDIFNYNKERIYDKEEMDAYKDALIDKYNFHYVPYELCFNTHRNIYKEEKMLLNISERLKKKEMKENEERDEELDDKEKEQEHEKDKSENGELFDEELRSEDDYNFDYNKSEDEFENDENDKNII